jgi:protein-disulfide isomerase
MSRFFDRLLTGLMVACALVVTGLALRNNFGRPPSPSAPPQVKDWRRYTTAGQVMGSSTAKLRVVEFADFQCPYCARLRSRLEDLRRDSDGRVAVVFRHFPLENHPHAFEAAVAAECAARGGRFEEFHDVLFEHQDSIGKKSWARFAAEAGVSDTAAFNRCRQSPEAQQRVRQDAHAAQELRLTGTPTLLIGGRMVAGLPKDGELEQLVRDALRENNSQ